MELELGHLIRCVRHFRNFKTSRNNSLDIFCSFLRYSHLCLNTHFNPNKYITVNALSTFDLFVPRLRKVERGIWKCRAYVHRRQTLLNTKHYRNEVFLSSNVFYHSAQSNFNSQQHVFKYVQLWGLCGPIEGIDVIVCFPLMS